MRDGRSEETRSLKKCILKAVGVTVASVLIAGCGQQVFAQSFDDGMEAIKNKDFEQAFQILMPSAEQGDEWS